MPPGICETRDGDADIGDEEGSARERGSDRPKRVMAWCFPERLAARLRAASPSHRPSRSSPATMPVKRDRCSADAAGVPATFDKESGAVSGDRRFRFPRRRSSACGVEKFNALQGKPDCTAASSLRGRRRRHPERPRLREDRFGARLKPQGQFDNNAERAFRADEEAGEVVSR